MATANGPLDKPHLPASTGSHTKTLCAWLARNTEKIFDNQSGGCSRIPRQGTANEVLMRTLVSVVE